MKHKIDLRTLSPYSSIYQKWWDMRWVHELEYKRGVALATILETQIQNMDYCLLLLAHRAFVNSKINFIGSPQIKGSDWQKASYSIINHNLSKNKDIESFASFIAYDIAVLYDIMKWKKFVFGGFKIKDDKCYMTYKV